LNSGVNVGATLTGNVWIAMTETRPKCLDQDQDQLSNSKNT